MSTLGDENRFRAVNPRTGEEIGPDHVCADAAQVNAAATNAAEAFGSFGASTGELRAALLESASTELDGVHDELIERASLETGLAPERLDREFARTTSTLRMFAAIAREDTWRRAAIDPPTSGAAPGSIAANDVRRMLMPLGPVAVFGASNFPLAYGVAGGDTASALAAGCPVVVKGHPSHPGTGALAADALMRAVSRCGAPAGVFTYVPSGGAGEMRVGMALIEHPEIRAVGFTGSFKGGMALAAAAAKRPQPIPVFAEMGSTNPVCILPVACVLRPEPIAEQLVASILDSSGQQCTCPGILLMIDSSDARRLTAAMAARLDASAANVMLSRRVRDGYHERVRASLDAGASATAVLASFARSTPPERGPVTAAAGLLETSFEAFHASPALREEIFGPAALVVWCADESELRAAISEVPGALTATVYMTDDDHACSAEVVGLLARGAGRVIFNGVPTGVRVASGMVHGGPYPATNRPETTAVGPYAIERWTRPVCFQNAPAPVLPGILRTLR